MKWKLKYSEFDNVSGRSCVIISTKDGDFKSFSKVHNEDKDIQSEFFGCRIAEMKAVEKYLKTLIKEKKKKVVFFENLLKSIQQLKYHNEKSAEYIFINKQYEIEKKELDEMIQSKIKLKEQIIKNIADYRPEHSNFLNKIQKNREKRQNATQETEVL